MLEYEAARHGRRLGESMTMGEWVLGVSYTMHQQRKMITFARSTCGMYVTSIVFNCLLFVFVSRLCFCSKYVYMGKFSTPKAQVSSRPLNNGVRINLLYSRANAFVGRFGTHDALSVRV